MTRLPLDVHLMISEPARYVEAFRRAGADLMTIHIEAVPEPRPAAAADPQAGRVGGAQPESAHRRRRRGGVSRRLRPGAGDERHARLRRTGVRAGGSGEASPFAGRCPARVAACRSTAASDADNIGLCAQAGADLLVMGSALHSRRITAGRSPSGPICGSDSQSRSSVWSQAG